MNHLIWLVGGAAVQVEVLLRIAGVGLLVTAICQVLTRAGREEIATLATVAGILLVLFIVVNLAGELIAQVQAVFHLS
jgi:stage III sporulation protein AC